jgi:hypothetical protein
MLNLTEERMIQILSESTPLATEYEIAQFLNHPEIKSLFEKINHVEALMHEYAIDQGSDSIVGLSVCSNFKEWLHDKVTWPTEATKERGDIESVLSKDEIIKTCDFAPEGSSDYSCETTAKYHRDGTIEILEQVLFKVIEYTFLSNADFGHFDTPCNNDGQIRFIGGISCEACKHFAGHEVEGKSIRCAHKHNEGEV